MITVSNFELFGSSIYETNIDFENIEEVMNEVAIEDLADHPLHRAAALGEDRVLKKLLQDGAAVNKAASYNLTPLHIAASYNQQKCAMVLLNSGAKVNVTEKDDNITPLHYTAWNGNWQLMKWLLDTGADTGLSTSDNLKPWMIAGLGGKYKLMEKLLDSRNIDEIICGGHTLLHCACTRGQLELVKRLLLLGADVNKRTANQKTPIMFAICGSEDDHNLECDLVRVLTKAGADCSAHDQNGYTVLPLMLNRYLPDLEACYWPKTDDDWDKYVKILDMFLAAGADLEVPLPDWPAGFTPLLYYAGDPQVSPWLLKAGANPNAITPQNLTVIYCAVEQRKKYDCPEILELLYMYNVDISLTGIAAQTTGLTPLQLLLERRYHTNDLDWACSLVEYDGCLQGMKKWLTPKRRGQFMKEDIFWDDRWDKVMDVILTRLMTPQSLQALTRMTVRRLLGPGHIAGKLKKLQLPSTVEKYMSWSDYIRSLPPEVRLWDKLYPWLAALG